MRTICFVTGTRAEFGLMRSALEGIRAERKLTLQLVATGMHLDSTHGPVLQAITSAGFEPDEVVDWPATTGGATPTHNAIHTGAAIANLARALDRLRSNVVLVVGDRVEAFAAATAAHLSNRIVAHVHGGDRAQGQVDDSLRHAITKLAHLHFPATTESARRIHLLGEQRWRIHRVGSPGVDGIRAAAGPRAQLFRQFSQLKGTCYGMLLLHPTDANQAVERRRAELIVRALRGSERVGHLVVLYPNNDPGSRGIISAYQRWVKEPRITLVPDLPRSTFLGLLRDAAFLAGNSSSGIIEAASFGTPVLDIGPRQSGRQRSRNVLHCDWSPGELKAAIERLPRNPKRVINVYGGDGAGKKIARILCSIDLTRFRQPKLIRY